MIENKIKLNRSELSGAFGDIGTDLPLLIGIILVSGLNPLNVFLIFGLLQIISGLLYGIPIPLQPLKAIAAITIAMGLSGEIVTQAGLMLGIIMLFLTLTGAIGFISRIVPECVIRGIQFGLGIKLSILAVTIYIPSLELPGIALASILGLIIIFSSNNTKYPAILFALLIGGLFGGLLFFSGNLDSNILNLSIKNEAAGNISILNTFILLVIPQLALSIGNSILATRQLADDYFPQKKLTDRKLSLSYSIFNIIVPFLGGVPVCHGSGGLAGHYRFGARTGGSLFIYGIFSIILGLLFYKNLNMILVFFPLPILGLILLFEALSIGKQIFKVKTTSDITIAILVGVICGLVNYGFIIGLVLGTFIYIANKNLGLGYKLNVKN